MGSTWSKPFHNSSPHGRTSFPLVFRLGPYRLTQLEFDLTIIDLGPKAIAGAGVDARVLPSDRALFLKSAPDRLGLRSSDFAEKMLVYPFYDYQRSWVVTEGGFDAYFSSFSKVSRKGLKRRCKKLAELSGGTIDIRRFDQADLMPAFHADAREVSAKTFQEKLMDDGLPASHSFVETMASSALAGRCHGTILYLEGKPISYLYCERQGEGWLAAYGGFDPAYACHSPGTVHLLKILEGYFDDPGCVYFDFGPGRSDYKQFFSTHDEPCSDILVLDRTPANRLATGVHRSLASLSEVVIGLAETLQLRERLRQKIRER